jgi:hypothetical protein
MESLSEFKASLHSEQPVSGLSAQLKSLWHDGKGDWHKAHAQVDQLNDPASAWVHATCTGKRVISGMPIIDRAGQTRAKISLDEEWQQLALQFL